MHIWRKRVETNWLRSREDGLTRRFGRALAITDRPEVARALLEISCPTKQRAQQLLREFGGRIEKLRPGWLQGFARKTQTKPLRIGSRLLILGAQPRRSGATRALVIPAEAAFGTGQHATTAMCLRLLEETTRGWKPGWTLLDAGTGSGILALAGRCLGAKRVLAIENDPLACAIAKRNARANSITRVEFRRGDVLKQKFAGKFDAITANLYSEILMAGLPVWQRHLSSKGCLILSGVLRTQEAGVVRALRQDGFAISETRRRGKWIALLARRRREKGG